MTSDELPTFEELKKLCEKEKELVQNDCFNAGFYQAFACMQANQYSRSSQRDLVERLLESYCNEHPELREMYCNDNLTNRIMQDCAINGHTLGTMLFRLAQAQLVSRQEVERKHLEYVQMQPNVSFYSPIP